MECSTLQESHVKTLNEISHISKDVNDVKEKIDRINVFNDTKNETPQIPLKNTWVKEPDVSII